MTGRRLVPQVSRISSSNALRTTARVTSARSASAVDRPELFRHTRPIDREIDLPFKTLEMTSLSRRIAIQLRANDKGYSPAKVTEHGLHGWVAFLVMPLFAYANAGVPLDGFDLAQLTALLSLAIMLGLFVGKQIGVFGFAYGAIRMGLAAPPKHASMAHYGVSLLAGIGFTMSLFIGALAYVDPEHQTLVRIGVISGSLLSDIVGAGVLLLIRERAPLQSLTRQSGHP